jgi:cytochrome c-type biogenesis protein CcmE
MTTGKKLAALAVVVVGVTGYMAYVGASASWQYYATVDECATMAAKLAGHRIRVSGTIAANSLQIAADRGEARFSLTGSKSSLHIICRGPLPDNLAEGMDVVVEGYLEDAGLLRGHKLITRCAGKYEAQELPAAAQDNRPIAIKEG